MDESAEQVVVKYNYRNAAQLNARSFTFPFFTFPLTFYPHYNPSAIKIQYIFGLPHDPSSSRSRLSFKHPSSKSNSR